MPGRTNNPRGINQYTKGGNPFSKRNVFHKGLRSANSSNAGVNPAKSLLNIKPVKRKKK